ncbi:hypothetical protein X798_04208 [Onchocerca flexuosa]|uniref:Uncharacterized protein n=1 Tax=Onchocerca flexuosa TaxID=387005 RepID=A0A238BU14_9BILA|nr:hypothetical protein X798_04208 [Onchocerca flexuosa]
MHTQPQTRPRLLRKDHNNIHKQKRNETKAEQPPNQDIEVLNSDGMHSDTIIYCLNVIQYRCLTTKYSAIRKCGSYTDDVSAKMPKKLECIDVIPGYSERTYETDCEMKLKTEFGKKR